MERRYIPEAENRLLILYALNRLGPVTSTQLLRFLMEFDLMNYITMQLGLSGMEEQGQLRQHPHPLGGLLELTDAGRYTLKEFEHRVPISSRELMDLGAQTWHERFRLEQQTPADSSILPSGEQYLRLQYMEGDDVLMDILLLRTAEKRVTGAQEKWHAAAHRVYGLISRWLIERYDPDGYRDKRLPTGVTLQQAGERQWYLFLEMKSMTLMLSLPDEGLARCCAMAWPERALDICRLVEQAMTDPSRLPELE